MLTRFNNFIENDPFTVNYVHWHYLSRMLHATNSEMMKLLAEFERETSGIRDSLPRYVFAIDPPRVELIKSNINSISLNRMNIETSLPGQIISEVHNVILGGFKKNFNRWMQCVDEMKLNHALSYRFVKDHFTEETYNSVRIRFYRKNLLIVADLLTGNRIVGMFCG